MRAGNKSESRSDELREQYLGELAPLLEAARQLESLSPVQKKRVRRRIARSLFGTRPLTLRARLLPVLAALGLLVIGGAAFATAQRLGLLPKLGLGEAGAPKGDTGAEARRRKPRGRVTARPASGDLLPPVASEPVAPPAEPPAVVLPAVPDPLLVPGPQAAASVPAPALAAPSASPAATASGLLGKSETVAAPAKAARLPTGQLGKVAMAAPRPVPKTSARETETPATAPAMAYPAPGSRAAAPGEDAPSPAMAMAGALVAPLPPPAAPQHPAPPANPAVSAPPAVPPPIAAPAPPAAQPAPPPALTDQALFGQALRKLRKENDAASALALLREHAGAYPASALAGERSALEVEALLALHRDRDALALLDGMALDELPRRGERLVVRGELRAAARRWREAEADFDRALAGVSGSPAWHERALWGRGVARLRQNERESGMADITRYHDAYPQGRFAAEAAKFFPKK